MELILDTEPTVKRRDRTITADWLVREEADKRLLLTLAVHHSVERKRFWASFGQETENIERGYTTRSFWLGGSVTIAQESVARFSAKTQEAFFAGAVATLRTLIAAGDERVAKVLTLAE